jgi:hypothetical protein
MVRKSSEKIQDLNPPLLKDIERLRIANHSNLIRTKTKYEEWMREAACNYYALGATMEQIASYLNVERKTFYNWMDVMPEWKEAILEAREKADLEVVHSTRANAIGFYKEETQVFIYRGQIIEKQVKKYYPPNPVTQKFWLINRQRANWTDTSEVKHSGVLGLRKVEDIPLNELNQEEQDIIFSVNLKQLEEGKIKKN